MKKKLLSVLCCTAMLTGLLAGCTSNAEKPGSTSTEASTAAQESTTAAEEASKPEEQTADLVANGDYKVALITMDSIDQHWITLHEGARLKRMR